MNWTVPVGVAVLIPAPAVLATVAVKVTACPTTDGFTDEVTLAEVGAGFTVWPTLPELPLTKFPSVFEYTALTMCGEPLTIRVAVAPVTETVAPEPDSVTAEPKGAPSIENWTEPVGVAVLIATPAVLATVAVNVTD
jgi:hypothetical protein